MLPLIEVGNEIGGMNMKLRRAMVKEYCFFKNILSLLAQKRETEEI